MVERGSGNFGNVTLEQEWSRGEDNALLEH